MWRDETLALDMLIAARKARSYLGETSFKDLEADGILQDALVRQLSIIGEAASRISDDYQAARRELPWRAIVGMRNRIVHEYWSVDVSEVWRTTDHDLSPLIEQLERLVPPE